MRCGATAALRVHTPSVPLAPLPPQLTAPLRAAVRCMVARAAPAGDTLRINFNFSFPHLACQYASVDVSDVLGMARAQHTWHSFREP